MAAAPQAPKAPVMPCGISASKPAVTGSVTVSPEDIKRVKAFGFLHNKGTDCFNAVSYTHL